MKFVAEALHLAPPAARRLEDRNILRKAVIKHSFFSDILDAYNLQKKFGEYEEGTLIVKTQNGVDIVRGYPKIRRALTLYPTIMKHFEGEVVLEEKMNGYNVRIVHFGRNIYAVTRRGFVCPYTTEKARELIDIEFFKDHPNLMLCSEAVGEESPFVPKDVYGVKTIDFFVFDIRDRKTNTPLPVREKEKLADEYGFKIAPILAVVHASKAHEVAVDIIRKLGEEGREGVIIKDPEMNPPPIKYTTSQSNCSDLRYAFRYFNEYSKDFMLSRIVREAFQSFEFKENENELKERCLRLGEAILKSMIESIKEVSEGKKVVEKYRLRFKSLEVFELFKEHLRRMGVDAEFSEPVEDNGTYVVYLEKYMMGTTDKILHHLKGNLW